MSTTRCARPAVLAAVMLAAIALTGCSAGQDEGGPVTIGVRDASVIQPVGFDEIAAGDCIGGTGPIDGKAPSVSCDEAGAMPVQAVVVLGEDAPAERPAPSVVNGYAIAACQDTFQQYADDLGVPLTGLLQITVISDTDWQGPQTPVVCAVSGTE
ncbi:hypothetical protein ACGIF2_04020 [Cellulomonas sp. P22]|uniref:hypothetical protein n=1 Tax=Cellulomonas sp. P22 TaxID=3373189 RepID=UPI0037B43107